MPASTRPQTWPWSVPPHPWVRAPVPPDNCPSPNHLIGDRVNTETSYHPQREAFQSLGDVTAPVPSLAPAQHAMGLGQTLPGDAQGQANSCWPPQDLQWCLPLPWYLVLGGHGWSAVPTARATAPPAGQAALCTSPGWQMSTLLSPCPLTLWGVPNTQRTFAPHSLCT